MLASLVSANRLTEKLETLALLTASVHYGLGLHASELGPEGVSQAMKLQWAFQPGAVLSNTVARISISFLLVRLFPRNKALKWGLVVLATLNTAAAIVGVTLIYTQCRPAAKLWDSDLEGYCMSGQIQVALATTKAGKFTSLRDHSASTNWPQRSVPHLM